MQQTAVHNNAVVLSELPVERSEASGVLSMLESEPLYMEFLMSPVIFYRKKETVELRFYEIPQGEPVLALLGEEWNRVYGHDSPYMHFHNDQQWHAEKCM